MSRHLRALALLSLALLLAAPATANAADTARVPIAVSYFDNTSGNAELAPLQKGLADMLITDLAAADELTVVERGRLSEVLGEVELQKNPYFDQKGAAKLGRGLGAAYVIVGAYLVQGPTLRLDARVVDVETSEVAATASAEGELSAFFDVQRKLALELLDRLGAKLNLLQRKKVGGQNTKSLEAFRSYSDALDARDRGDEKAEREALARALAADPDFARVRERLEALESKVAVLEKSGGRIINPTRAPELVHNARLDAAQGDYAAAREALAKACSLEPSLIDIWLLWAQVEGGPVAQREDLAIDDAMRGLIDAFVRKDLETLHSSQLKGSLPAAIFLVSLAPEVLPSPAVRPNAAIYDALEAVIAAQDKGKLAGLLTDPLPLVQSARQLRDRQFTAPRAAQLAHPVSTWVDNGDALFKPKAFWQITVNLFEAPQQPVFARIEPDRRHPSWSEKAGPRRQDRLWGMWSNRDQARCEQLKQASTDPKALIYRFDATYEDPYKYGELPGIASFGQEFEIPAEAARCVADSASVTGTRCQISFDVFKPSLAPGAYQLKLRYQAPDGRESAHEVQLFPFELKLVPHKRVVTDGGVAIYNGPERELIVLDEAHDRYFEGRLKGPRKMKVAAEVFVFSYYGAAEVYYDVDYGLIGGKPPEDGPKAWMQYRDTIRKRGYQLSLDNGQEHIPLPELAPGRHFLCVTLVRANGSVSPEAECHGIDVEEPR